MCLSISRFNSPGLISILMRSKTFVPQSNFSIKAGLAFLIILMLIFTVFAPGCKPKASPVTGTEAQALRASIDSAITERNAAFFDRLVDGDEMAERVAKQMPDRPNAETMRAIRSGAPTATFGKQIMIEIRQGAAYRFVRAYASRDREHLIYRLYSDRGLNYHDYELTRSGNAVKVADIMVYYTGETMSKTFADMLGGLERVTSKAGIGAEMTEMRMLMNDGKYRQAKAMHDAWPPAVRQIRLIELVNIQLLSALQEHEAHVAAVERFAAKYPEAPNAPLLMMDAYLLTGRFDKAMAAVRRIDSSVKGDPFLIYYRGLVSRMAGDTAQYREYIRQAYAASLDMDVVTLEMLFVALQTGDAVRARAAADEYRRSDGFDAAMLKSITALGEAAALQESRMQ